MKRRTLGLVLALAASVAAAISVTHREAEVAVVDVAAPRSGPVRVEANPSAASPYGLPARRFLTPPKDAFPTRSWEPPPPPPPKPLPPPPPSAPPLPYQYLGRWIEDGSITVFLADRGGRSISVKTGETLDGQWRVDEVAETQITFTYLPLDERRVLVVKQ